jgi:beta-lactamase superfamily II metal-dependent hydrolase
MERLIQYRTNASLYDGEFGGSSGWPAAGMGYIIVSENGKIIVIDGGYGDDAEEILSLLSKNSTSEIPHVDLWIVTHPHVDHYGALRELAANPKLSCRLTVGKIIYWFPLEFVGRDGKARNLENACAQMSKISSAFTAEEHRPYRGEKINIDEIEIEFLFVPDDCSILNTGGGNANLVSLIFTIKGKSKKIMFTGDAYGRTMQITAWRYKGNLACDILQMPHHGLCDAYNIDFYREVNAKTVLIPISAAGYREMHGEQYAEKEGRNHNLWVENNAETVYKAFEGTVEIEL